MMNDGDRLMAKAQIWLTFYFLSFVFAVTIIYELGHTHFNDSQDKNFSSWMNWLQGAALILIYFWFQRTRTSGIPDPTQVVTQTHTLPDGTTTVTTGPAVPSPQKPGVPPNAPLTSSITITPVASSGTGVSQ